MDICIYECLYVYINIRMYVYMYIHVYAKYIYTKIHRYELDLFTHTANERSRSFDSHVCCSIFLHGIEFERSFYSGFFPIRVVLFLQTSLVLLACL